MKYYLDFLNEFKKYIPDDFKSILKQKENNIKNSFVSRRKVDRPSFEQLKNEIDEFGLCGVGRKYGVSGNAIKKWVKTYEKYNI